MIFNIFFFVDIYWLIYYILSAHGFLFAYKQLYTSIIYKLRI